MLVTRAARTPRRLLLTAALGVCVLSAGCHLVFPFEPDDSLDDLGEDGQADGRADGGSDAPRLDGLDPDAPWNLGVACTSSKDCTGGHCVDGVCCEAACAGVCEACNKNRTGAPNGKCAPVPKGKDPDGECKGVPLCGGDVCDGSRKCKAFASPGVACGALCSANYLVRYGCHKGMCAASPTVTACHPYECQGSKCNAQCVDHSDCVPGSVCDRSAAHVTGGGTCVDPSKVMAFIDYLPLQTSIDSATNAGKTHLYIKSGAYTGTANLAKDLTIVGDGAGSTTLNPKTSFHVLKVEKGAKVTLQGLTFAKVSLGKGVHCLGTAAQGSAVTLVEVELKQNSVGLDSTLCALTLRRSKITANTTVGVKVYKGAFTLVNNLFVNNSGSYGAAVLSPGGKSTFNHNTVVSAAPSLKPPLSCSTTVSAFTITNSIVWGYGKASPTCSFTYSDVQGLSASSSTNFSKIPKFVSSTDFSLQAGSPCIGAGNTSLAASKLDIDGNPRVKNKTDMGAYEQ